MSKFQEARVLRILDKMLKILVMAMFSTALSEDILSKLFKKFFVI